MICNNCNKENIEGRKYCFYCGYDLTQVQDKLLKEEPVDNSEDEDSKSADKMHFQSENTKKNISGKSIVVISILSVVIISVIILVIVISSPQNTIIPSQLEQDGDAFTHTVNIQENIAVETDGSTSDFYREVHPQRLVDLSHLLNANESEKLEEKLDNNSKGFSFDIVIVTVDSLDGKTDQEYADDYYDDNGYGYGARSDGVLLLVAMNERKMYITTSGSGINIIDNGYIDYIFDTIQTDMSDGNYYKAFNQFVDLITIRL